MSSGIIGWAFFTSGAQTVDRFIRREQNAVTAFCTVRLRFGPSHSITTDSGAALNRWCENLRKLEGQHSYILVRVLPSDSRSSSRRRREIWQTCKSGNAHSTRFEVYLDPPCHYCSCNSSLAVLYLPFFFFAR